MLYTTLACLVVCLARDLARASIVRRDSVSYDVQVALCGPALQDMGTVRKLALAGRVLERADARLLSLVR